MGSPGPRGGSPGLVVFKEALKLKRKSFKEAGASVFWKLRAFRKQGFLCLS